MPTWVEDHGFSMFKNYNLTLLDMDQAWLNITNNAHTKLWLYQLSKDCLECPYTKVYYDRRPVEIEPNEFAEIMVSTVFPTKYRLETDGTEDVLDSPDNREFGVNTHCNVETSMGEFGVYEMEAKNGKTCDFITALDPVSIYLPFLIPLFIYIGLAIFMFLFKRFKHKLLFWKKAPLSRKNTPGSVHSSNPPPAPIAPARQRLRSLDTFRGISICIMMFVNFGAAGYHFLEHATWDGLNIGDLVFPWFLWIMGVCIPVSIRSQVKKNTPFLKIAKRILIRSIKLIALGVMHNTIWGPVKFNELRIPGILQRFGICYFVCAILVLICARDGFVDNRKANNKYIAAIQDIVFIWKGWAVVIGITILHTCLTFFLKVPGCPTGYLGPGGLHEYNAYDGECIGGAAGYIDREVFTLKHIYQWPTAKGTYRSTAYDPEGFLGTLTSILNVWLGVQAGLVVQVYPKHRSRLVRWAIWAVLLGALGAALCGGKQTGGPIPLNKNLWSLSFVFVLGSFALVLLIALYMSIDIYKIWSGTPFLEPGMNSIFLYVGHSYAHGMIPWHFSFNDGMKTHFRKLVEALWGVSMWVVYSIYLYHKKWFWSL